MGTDLSTCLKKAPNAMTDQPNPLRAQLDPTPNRDDWLEHLLVAEAREHRDGYIADDGFTARVMEKLPAAVAAPAWRKLALVVMWGAVAVVVATVLPQVFVDAAREVYKLVAAQPVSLSGIGGALLAACALTWGAAAYTLRAAD